MVVSGHWPSQAPYEEFALPELLHRSAEAFGDKPALIGADGTTRTYRELWSHACKVSRLLQDHGIEKGDKVGIFSPNYVDYASVFYGILLAGATVTTLNPLYREREIEHQLDDAEAVALFAFGPMAAPVEVARKNLPRLRHVWPIEGLPNLLGDVSEEYRAVDINAREDIAVLPYSSGTTGLPKGVMLTHHNITSNVKQGLATGQLTSDAVSLCVLPFFHIYGMTVLLSIGVALGITGVVMMRFDVEQMLELVGKYGMTNLYLAPPAVLAMANVPNPSRFDTSALRLVHSGAAALPPEVAERVKSIYGCLVLQGYGLTETSPSTNTHPLDRIKLESVGLPMADTFEKIVSLDTGEELPAGEVGEVAVKGPQVMKGYWKRPEETRECLSEDGWLLTGDIGWQDEDGYLYILDRKKEMIKYKGYQVAPAELEALLYEHPAVLDAAVIPKRQLEGGEIPKALVVLKEGSEASPEELMAFVAEKVAPYKKIREVEYLSEIPKSAAGKILRRELIERERSRKG
ncbi:MAG: AMP-binding protein [Dehalococcoidia bacterium]|nr:MAG: AMP-binding protein [Dehalococcoidia bacterium]